MTLAVGKAATIAAFPTTVNPGGSRPGGLGRSHAPDAASSSRKALAACPAKSGSSSNWR